MRHYFKLDKSLDYICRYRESSKTYGDGFGVCMSKGCCAVHGYGESWGNGDGNGKNLGNGNGKGFGKGHGGGDSNIFGYGKG